MMNFHPTKAETDAVRAALSDFNERAVGADGHTALNITLSDEKGGLIGGLLGGTYWGWLYIDILWVKEEHRGQGIGSKLLAEAEAEAIRRGCHHAHLDTMSWQAPDFYKKHGYETIGVLPDIPQVHQKHLLMKKLI